jgi:hypothetical protein
VQQHASLSVQLADGNEAELSGRLVFAVEEV